MRRRRLALEHGLHLLYKHEFHDVFAAEREHPDYGPLLQRMKVVSATGESQMDEDQWEAASTWFPAGAALLMTVSADIYLAFAFEKR